MTESFRRPAAFRVDDPRVVIPEPQIMMPEASDQALVAADSRVTDVIANRSRRWRWGTLFWSACSGLVLLALGITVTNFVEELFARTPALGAIGLGLAVIADVALFALVGREVFGLVRLGTIEKLRHRALIAIENDDREQGRAVVQLVEEEFQFYGPTTAVRRLARVACYFAKTLPDFDAFKREVRDVKNVGEFKQLAKAHFR